MPYPTNNTLPEHVKKYSEKIQSQWRHVFNSVHSKVLKETSDAKSAESRAVKAANSVLKKRFKNGQNLHKESHSDYFKNIVDQYLGNLNG
jgi:cation transport regulator ChaB